MNNKIKVILGGFCCILILLGVSMLNNQSEFTGSRVNNPNYYSIEFTKMNGTDTVYFDLKAEEVVEIKHSITKGKVSLSCGIEGKDAVYTGNQLKDGYFQVTVHEDGKYTIKVEASKAAGSILVKVK